MKKTHTPKSFKITIAILFLVLILLKLPEIFDDRPPLYRDHHVKIWQQRVDIGNHVIKDRNGELHTIGDVIGEKPVTVLMMWATWCGYCAREMPDMVQLYTVLQEHKMDVGMVMIAEMNDTPAKIRSFYKKHHVPETMPAFMATSPKIYQQLAIKGVPKFFLLNAQGEVFAEFRPDWKRGGVLKLLQEVSM